MVPHARKPLTKAILGVWAGLSVVLVAYTLGAHLTSLPAPLKSDPALVRGLRLLFPSHAGGLLVAHVLYDRCGCSSRVAKSLLARGPRLGVRESVLMIGDDTTTMDRTDVERLSAAGFATASMSTRQVAERLHVQAVPFLVIVDSGDRVRYAGGYTASRDLAVLEDDRLIAEVGENHDPSSLPIFGCATAADLQKKLDPLGIKY